MSNFIAVLRKLWNGSVSRVFGVSRGELNSDSPSSQSTFGGPAPTNISFTPSLASNAFRVARPSEESATTDSISSGTRPARSPSAGDEDDFISVYPPGKLHHRRQFSLATLHSGFAATSTTCEEGHTELSPPPRYSQHKVFSSQTTRSNLPNEERNHGEYHTLQDYSNLDLKRETSSSSFTQRVELSLEDFFHSKHLLYGFTMKLRGGKTLRQTLDVVIPPGCPTDTVYSFLHVGHELAEDAFQDIHLLFVEKTHPLGFIRTGPDISTSLRLPWTESLEEGPRRFSVTGIDGKKYTVEIDYRFSKMVDGSVTFYEAGMPMPDGRGRGKFIVRWQIYSPSSPCED